MSGDHPPERPLPRAPHPETILRFEDVEVDVGDRLCRASGERVPLTPKELGILEALWRKASHTVSRQDLLVAVWAEDVERGRRALDVYMTHLRRKLTSAYSRASVATVRGTGFRMAELRLELPTHLVLEAAPDGMLVVDATGEILMVNAMTERLFGYPRSELVGATLETLIPQRFAVGHQQHRKRFSAQGAEGLAVRVRAHPRFSEVAFC